MRQSILLMGLLVVPYRMLAQAPDSDDALLSKARSLYDAPFTRNLVSFDCAVQFDWKGHFQQSIGSVPPAAVPMIDQLQAIPHRVFVDRSGATVSAIPKTPDLSSIPHIADLEQALDSIVKGGINAWIPFATNVILPIKPTRFAFQKAGTGYTVAMNGNGVDVTLLLGSDMRLTSGDSQLPQQMRFKTRFIDGPDGYLLESEAITPTDGKGGGESAFNYKFQPLQSIQLPSEVTVTPANSEVWHFSLADCKLMTGITIKVSAPPTVQ